MYFTYMILVLIDKSECVCTISCIVHDMCIIGVFVVGTEHYCQKIIVSMIKEVIAGRYIVTVMWC